MEKILHFQNNKWVPIEKKFYDDEAHLQNMLADDVNLLPFDEIGYETPFVTIGKEVGLTNGSLDLLAVSPEGHIALIETKLDKNPEVKRTVVGQILGYAAYLWNRSYEDLENYYKKFLVQQKIQFEGTLFEYINSKIPDLTISEADFRAGIEKRLQYGSFSLFIVVDQANQELKDIANYLNDRTGQEIDFYVVELELIGDGNEQFLIPRLVNPPRKNISSTTSQTSDNYDRTPMSPEVFYSRLSKPGLLLAKELIKLENQNEIKLVWRKNGFSLMNKLPNGLITPGVANNFSYFFFKSGENNNPENDELQFGYPEWFMQNTKIDQTIKDYIAFYHSLNGYDPKRNVVQDLSIFDTETTTKFINFIKDTAQKLNKEQN